MQILTGLGKEPAALAFSPDGRYLAGGDGRAHHLWDLGAGPPPLWSVRHPRTNPRTFCFTADGRSLIRRFDNNTFHRHAVLTGTGEVDAALSALDPFTFSTNGLIAAGWGGRTAGAVRVWCARSDGSGGWPELWRREFAYDETTGAGGYELIEFSPDAKRLGSVFRRGVYRSIAEMGVEVLGVGSGEPTARWEGELPGRVRNGAVGPSGAVVVLDARNFYAVETGTPGAKPVRRQNASAQHFTSAAFSCDGRRLATTSNDAAATVWDTATWEVQRRYEWQIGRLRTACFAPDGLRCAAGSDSGQIVVWDLDG